MIIYSRKKVNFIQFYWLSPYVGDILASSRFWKVWSVPSQKDTFFKGPRVLVLVKRPSVSIWTTESCHCPPSKPASLFSTRLTMTFNMNTKNGSDLQMNQQSPTPAIRSVGIYVFFLIKLINRYLSVLFYFDTNLWSIWLYIWMCVCMYLCLQAWVCMCVYICVGVSV